MIAVVDVSVQAQNPSLPLYPWRAFLNSPSSLRIRNVPRKIGLWILNEVSVQAHYPDNQILTARCVQSGGVWACTLPGSGSAGRVTAGYSVLASGVDESGNPIEGYVLGKGDIDILKSDLAIDVIPDSYAVTLHPERPEKPNAGDIWPEDETWYIWDGSEAKRLNGLSEADVEDMLKPYLLKAEASETYQPKGEYATESDLSGYVPTSRTINGKALSSNVTLYARDVHALQNTATATLKADFPIPGSLEIESGQIGASISLYGGDGHEAGGPEILIGFVNNAEMAHGGILKAYSGSQTGAQAIFYDSSANPDVKAEITIGDVKVRESITSLQTTLAPVTDTLSAYVKEVVEETYPNAEEMEF